jgi:hypothetical protein
MNKKLVNENKHVDGGDCGGIDGIGTDRGKRDKNE